jgi:hypothetical protein
LTQSGELKSEIMARAEESNGPAKDTEALGQSARSAGDYEVKGQWLLNSRPDLILVTDTQFRLLLQGAGAPNIETVPLFEDCDRIS